MTTFARLMTSLCLLLKADTETRTLNLLITNQTHNRLCYISSYLFILHSNLIHNTKRAMYYYMTLFKITYSIFPIKISFYSSKFYRYRYRIIKTIRIIQHIFCIVYFKIIFRRIIRDGRLIFHCNTDIGERARVVRHLLRVHLLVKYP